MTDPVVGTAAAAETDGVQGVDPATPSVPESPAAPESEATTDQPEPAAADLGKVDRETLVASSPRPRTADLRAAAAAYRADRESRRDCLERLNQITTGLAPIDSSVIDRWVERLRLHRVLLLSCVDRQILNAVARTLPFHTQFAEFNKFQLVREEPPTVWEVLDARVGASAVVVAYAAGTVAERFLRSLPTDPFEWSDLRADLETTGTWLLVLTTPDSLGTAGLRSVTGLEWADTDVDFIGPRLRGTAGSEADDLERVFRRQRAAGYWGDNDERCLDLIERHIADGSLKRRIEHLKQVERGQASSELEVPPDWNALLSVDRLDERALNELILFVETFFREHPEEPLPGLPIDRLDTIVRALIPIASQDVDLRLEDSSDSPAKRLERLWARQGPLMMKACGLRPLKSNSGGIVAVVGDRLWRDDLLTLFTSEQYWVFGRLAGYVRRPEFILGSQDVSRGAVQIAVAQADASSGYNDRILLEWVLACAPPAAAGLTESERLDSLLQNMPSPRRGALASWLANLIRAWQQPERAAAALGQFIDLRSHDLAAAVLQRLWGAAGFGDACLSLAKRLLSEAPAQVKDRVVEQMRLAVRRGDVPLFEVWRQNWLLPDSVDPSIPGRVAAGLLVEACESSIVGVGSYSPLREVFQSADRDQMQALVSWLWHPAVDSAIQDREIRVAALPGLWILPQDFRRRALGGTWDAAQTLLTAWWVGFSLELRRSMDVADPLPLMFRAMVLTDWVVCSENTAAQEALTSAVGAVVPKASLASLRHFFRALDGGIGRALEVLISAPIVSPSERRVLEARLRPLREQLRKLRQSAVPVVESSRGSRQGV